MAECHPVGFQWVMEAKARGATVIHVDPRFTRTSALADLHVPLRAGYRHRLPRRRSINHVLQQRDSTSATTCSPTPTRPRSSARTSATPRTWTGCSPATTRETGRYDPRAGSTRAPTVQAAAGSGTSETRSRPGSSRPQAAARERTAPAAATSAGNRARDETLQHPRCVFQILKRHFARYTPEMVEQMCGVPPERSSRSASLLDRELRAGAHDRLRVRGGLDPAHGRRAVHPRPRRSCSCCSATSAAPAAASWRCAGTPRSRAPPTSPPCSTCCPATSRCRTRTPARTWTASCEAEAAHEGLLGATCAPTRSAC